MSVRVLEEVFDRSRATGTARTVLGALAEVAHHDGVTWCQQGPRENRKSIAHRANCDVRTVERSVGRLVELGELEVRRARRGRSFVNVYRVVVGRIAYAEVEYDRLPFELDEPFSTVEELRAGGARSTRQVVGMNDGENRDVHPDNLPGSRDKPNPTDQERPPRQVGALTPTDATATPSIDPSLDPNTDPSNAAAKSSSSSNGAQVVERLGETELERELQRLRIAADVRTLALADPERAQAWLELAPREARENPGGFVAAGIRSGDWPSPRGEQVTADRRHAGRVESLRSLVGGGAAEEAHDLVEGWETLTQVERNEYHLLVDELVSEQLPETPAVDASRSVA